MLHLTKVVNLNTGTMRAGEEMTKDTSVNYISQNYNYCSFLYLNAWNKKKKNCHSFQDMICPFQ